MSTPAPAGKPVWLLDIDGVINALSREPIADSWQADQWVQHVVRADIPGAGLMVLPIFAAQPVLDFVTDTAAGDAVDVIWHSTWREAAVTDLAPTLGLPALPVSVAPEWDDKPVDGWWKLPAAKRVLESGRRLVWTDDDIAVLSDEVEELAAHPDALLISPDRRIGLTRDQLEQISDFLDLPDRPAPKQRRGLARLLRR